MSAIAKVSNKGKALEILLYNDIGPDGFSARALVEALQPYDLKTPILCRMSSDGGDCFDGFAIYTEFARRSEALTVRIEGHAASMATVIACAAHRVEIVANGLYMIHNPRGGVEGEEGELRNAADLVGKLRAQIAGVYAKRTGLPIQDIENMMAATTWLTAEEALQLKFVDVVLPAVEISAKAASFLTRFQNAPKSVGALVPTEGKTSTPHEKLSMKKLLDALVERKLIASAELNEDEAAAGFTQAFGTLNAELETLRTNAANALQVEAETTVAACASIAEEARPGWVAAYVANPASTKALLGGIKPVAVVAPATPAPEVPNKPLAIKSAPAAVESPEDLWKQYHAIKDGVERTRFFRSKIKPLTLGN